MDASFLVDSLSIGAAVFAGLILFWFLRSQFKRRFSQDTQWHLSAVKDINWAEKRKAPRISISWKAVIDTADQPMTVQLKDISLGGAFVVCAEPLPINARLGIAIDLPGAEPLSLNAEVVWTNANVPPDKVVHRGMGIRFVDNSREDREALNEAIAAALDAASPDRPSRAD
jgi:hypothetical protein